MNEKKGELSSALLDGEVDRASEERALVELLQGEVAERERFARYRLIGDVLRGESAVDTSSLAVRISEALANEPTVLAPPRAAAARWVKPLGGVALAASVAVAAVMLTPGVMNTAEDAGMPVTVAETPPLQAIPVAVIGDQLAETRLTSETPADRPKDRWQAVNPDLQERLNRLLIEHHEFSGRTGINGPVSHIGLVSYDGR